VSRIQPGVCRHCGCTEDNACVLVNGDGCCWTDRERMVCSNPSCIAAESARLAWIRMERLAEKPVVRKGPPEFCRCAVCSGRARGRCRRLLARRKGRAA
jgi:hypothetical protein